MKGQQYDNKTKFYRGITNERHYCEACNVWMGNDRQSILLHENGKKHKQNIERLAKEKRQEKQQQAKNEQFLQSTLAKITKEAHAKQQCAPIIGGSLNNNNIATADRVASNNNYYAVAQHQQQQQPQNSSSTTGTSNNNNIKKEKQQWEELKRKRIEQDQQEKEEENNNNNNKRNKKNIVIPPDQGHYTLDTGSNGDKTYLEGPTFGDVLEQDMPIQLWTGSNLASMQEKRLPERQHHWQNGLIVSIQKKGDKNAEVSSEETIISSISSVVVSYLQSSQDEEETIEKGVELNRIRIVLGSDYQSGIPNTLEEARILAVGGVVVEEQQQAQAEMDDTTGLSTWSTVTIQRTTQQQELKNERERQREKEKEKKRLKEKAEKEAEARKMEEAKVENADDSALGAYDIWSRGDKVGYKGVVINNTTTGNGNEPSVYETSNKLNNNNSSGKTDVVVKFKKKSSLFGNKKRKQNNNRRTTTADDL